MKSFNHQAIRNVHPTASTIKYSFEKEIHIVYDKDGNLINIDVDKVSIEHDRLEAEYDAQEYARNRELEYPTVQELVVALYDEDDKAAIEAKRAEIKTKYPKP